MKKKLFLFIFIFGSLAIFAQRMPQKLESSEVKTLGKLIKPTAISYNEKALTCSNDTLHYPLSKEFLLSDTSFYYIDIWQSDNEALSQAYIAQGATVTIRGVEFYARRSSQGGVPTNVVVRASVFSVDANYRPLTELGFGTITLTGTTAAWRIVTFSSPVNVTSNFAIVFSVTTTNGIADILINNIAINTLDEGLSYFRSNYLAPGLGFVRINTIDFDGTYYDFEPVVGPIVTYNLNTDFNVTPNPCCQGSTVNFNNISTPMTLINNRMFTFTKFLSYWGLEPDSTFVYDPLGNLSVQLWQENTTYQYASSGTYNSRFFVLGGFFKSCLDQATKSVTVHPLPSVSLTLVPNIVAENDPPFPLSGGSPVGGVYSGPGVIGGNTFNPSAAGVGTHQITYTYTDPNGCTNSASDWMTVEVVVGNNLETTDYKFLLAPNPASDFTTILLSTIENKPFEVIITDMQGRVVMQLSGFANNLINIPTSKIAKGSYIVRCVMDENVIQRILSVH